jgi:hypothetical protein
MEYRKLDDGKLLNVFSAGTMVSARNTLGQVPCAGQAGAA